MRKQTSLKQANAKIELANTMGGKRRVTGADVEGKKGTWRRLN
jgi:hypothetical protein